MILVVNVAYMELKCVGQAITTQETDQARASQSEQQTYILSVKDVPNHCCGLLRLVRPTTLPPM